MRKLAWLLAATLAAMTAPTLAQPGGAEALPATIDLPAVLGLVRDRSPRVAAQREQVTIAEADRITAGAYPNPSLAVGRFRRAGGAATLFEGTRQHDVALEVPLLIAGQRGARVAAADRGIDAARARAVLAAHELSIDAGTAFLGLVAAQERIARLATGVSDVARLRETVAAREASGMASRYDLARADVELSAWRTRLAEAEADRADQAGELATLLGLAGWRPVAAGSLQDLMAMLADGIDTSAPGLNPAVAAAESEEQAAHAVVDLAARERWPTPALTLGRTWTADPFGAANFVGLSVELPILDTRRGPLERARADARTSALRRAAVRAEAAANLERHAQVAAARGEALARFERDAAARLPMLRNMAEDAYLLGRSSILELLDATRTRYELELGRIELSAALAMARLRLLGAAGRLDLVERSASGTR